MTKYFNNSNDLAFTSSSKQHRYNMGLIGNCSYSALIDDKANIKWLCWPRFDSSFIFGALLDEKLGGNYSIESEGENVVTRQHYIPNTNILVTRFESDFGVFEVIDFAPRFFLNERYHKPNMFFRKIKKISGFPRLKIKCNPVGDYGKIVPEKSIGSNHIRFSGLEQPVRLTTNASLNFILQEKVFTLTEDIYLVLSWGIPIEGPLISTFEDFLLRTKKYWQGWVERCTLPKIFQDEVIRSALVLKLHQYEDTGGIVASITTSLPEIPGQGRNWDYRYAWLRDSYYTITAFNSLGHFSELQKYAHFIESINPSQKLRLQPVYCVDGSSEMTEKELALCGYLQNQPVRVGNGASMQIQNDAYGQVILTLYHLYTDARILEKESLSTKTLSNLLESIENTLNEPDNGIWEFRGRQSVHSYTLLFHWAGSAACIKIAESLKDELLAQRARKTMDQAKLLLNKCYLNTKKSYTQSIGSEELDASLIQMIILGFLEEQPKEISHLHLKAIQKELEIKHGFLLRYKHTDDFGVQKSAFLICSFWLVEALAYLDQIDEAMELFKVLLSTQNHLGLMSESYDVEAKSQWGNFPQAYSHVGLINSVFALDKAIKKPKFRL